jgi:hypothetical protein
VARQLVDPIDLHASATIVSAGRSVGRAGSGESSGVVPPVREPERRAVPDVYAVSPPYVFDATPEHVLYDDTIIVRRSWAALARLDWQPPEPRHT